MAFSAIVHLTAYSLNSTSPEGLPTKGRIELCIGAVKQMRDVWAVASTVMQQIKAISREIFAYNKPGADASEGSESWTTTEEEISRLLEDDTIWQDGLNAYMVSAAEQDPFRSLLDSG